MNTLLILHSTVRWMIVILGLVALVKFALGWLRNSAFGGMDRGLSSGFSGLIDLQVVLGLVFLVWTGVTGAGFPALRIEHALTMIIAAIVAHLPLRWRQAAARLRFRNSLVSVLVTLLLIYMGVARLPGGWSR